MEFLHKFLPELLLPLNVALVLGLWGIWRRRWRTVSAGLLVLLLASNRGVSWVATRMAEQWAVALEPASMPIADAIVVLSAGRLPAPGPVARYEWVDANRFTGGLELYQAGKAPLLVFTGARVMPDRPMPTEGALLRDEARMRGVPDAAMAVSEYVFNTADEAREVRSLLRDRGIATPRVLLVTSAFHMPRARVLFEQAGMQVSPFPVDFESPTPGLSWRLLVPHPNNLRATQQALREGYGRAYYALRAQLGI
jgi:uncharacterized SAM-binding protein YcdF (DUF218 family)